MRIPNKVRVGAQIYTIKLDKTVDRNGNFGECNLETMEMALAPDNVESRQQQTFIHECVEAMNHEYDLGLRHHQIELLELAVYQFIIDNPQIFK